MKIYSPKLVIFFIACSLAMTSCSRYTRSGSWRDYIDKEGKGKHIPADTTQQIVVWRTPNSDPGYLTHWLDSIKNHCGPLKITVFCGSCDSSLMLLTGAGIKTYIQTNGGSKGGGSGCSTCHVTGGGDTIYWSVNFPIDINDSVYTTDSSRPQLGNVKFRDTAVTVAVFDTGIDPTELGGFLYHSTIPTCLDPTATNGWNFPGKSDAVKDDFNPPHGHGAIVSTLITQEVKFYTQNSVKILPVKIHDSNGQSDLFSVLCGFAYAKERGASIINASFGYYAVKKPSAASGPVTDSSALLLKKYIQYYLTNNNILLIAAAGNQTSGNAMETAVFTNVGLTPPSDLRNLDNINFYPASLAADPELPNVIAVTTVDMNTKTVSPAQNYSPNVVDLGVNADRVIDPHYYFKNPRVAMGLSEGSSFATPIAAGIICAHYSQVKAHLAGLGMPFNKENILRFLLQPSVGVLNTVKGRIKTGVFFNNAPH